MVKKQQNLQRNKTAAKPTLVEDKPKFDIDAILGRNSDHNSNDKLSPSVAQVLMQTSESYSGAYPHPRHIKEWEETLPGCADRIFTQVEKQSDHRQSLEAKVVSSNIKNSERGQIFAFVIAMTMVIGSMILIGIGREITGMVALVIALTSLVGVFVYSKREGQTELARKKEMAEKIQKESEGDTGE